MLSNPAHRFGVYPQVSKTLYRLACQFGKKKQYQLIHFIPNILCNFIQNFDLTFPSQVEIEVFRKS